MSSTRSCQKGVTAFEIESRSERAVAAGLLGASTLPHELDWIDARLVSDCGVMGQDSYIKTAQVHPFKFTAAMATMAKERGVDMRLGAKVTKICYTEADVQGIEYLERKTNTMHTLDDVTDVVVTAGPWTRALLPVCRIVGPRARSVV